MKKILSVIALIYLINMANAQRVGIGTTTPNAAAALDISSTSKGFLPPRMTLTQRNAIVNPVAGLTLWCTNSEELQVYNGIKWTNAVGANTSTNVGVEIGNQIWAARNLDVATYRNGDPIPYITNTTDWLNVQSGAYCYYNFDPANAVYGKMYNFFAINDNRGLAPIGYKIPSPLNFDTLRIFVGGISNSLRETGIAHWNSPNTGATNSTGFTCLGGGHLENRPAVVSVFQNKGVLCSFWTSQSYIDPNNNNWLGGWYWDIVGVGGGVPNGGFSLNTENLWAGCYVRCIKN